MPDGICVFRLSITVKIAYDGYYAQPRCVAYLPCRLRTTREKQPPHRFSWLRGIRFSIL
jgi:hypothetical protein